MSALPILAVNTFSIICVLAALLLIYKGRKEWGWFLFAAFLAASSGDRIAGPGKPRSSPSAAAPILSAPLPPAERGQRI